MVEQKLQGQKIDIDSIPDIQFIGCNLIGQATMMMVDAWRENDLVKGRRAMIMIHTVESLGINQLESVGAYYGLTMRGAGPKGSLSKEENDAFVAFTIKCMGICSAIKHSINAPNIDTSMDTKHNVASKILDFMNGPSDE